MSGEERVQLVYYSPCQTTSPNWPSQPTGGAVNYNKKDG